MKTGVVMGYRRQIAEDFHWCVANRIPTCQLSIPSDLLTADTVEIVKSAVRESGMEITALVGNWTGPGVWNFVHGPVTLGIVPTAYRAQRMRELLQCVNVAQKLEVRDICTHMGFIPENPADPLYTEFLCALRYLSREYQKLDLRLNMETGQETPVTMLRVIEDAHAENLGVNFDPANLLMYGKANPIEALDILGGYVNGVHAKDGEYPTTARELGKEKPLGQGRVNIPAFVRKLKQIGYTGALTIEREISGEQQRKDVLAANAWLLDLDRESA